MKKNKKTPDGTPEKKSGFFRVLLRALAALAAVLLLAALVLTVIPMTETVSPKTVEGSADWMGRLDGSLCLNEIILPGAHDSASQHVQLGFVTKCQALTIRELLDAGVRYLDIRLAVGPEDGNGSRRMQLMHGFTKCRIGAMPWEQTLYLDRVLDQCVSFLKAHPTETVIFVVKHEYGSESTEEFQNLLNAALADRAEYCLLTDTLPTLEEARGKLVLFRRYADKAALGPAAGIHMDWKEQDGSGDLSKNTELNQIGSLRFWVQDRFCYKTEDKWTAFLAGLDCPDIQPGDVAIHFLSTKGTDGYGHPYGCAMDLNPLLASLPQDRLNGWIVVDFADAALCRHIWEANFAD